MYSRKDKLCLNLSMLMQHQEQNIEYLEEIEGYGRGEERKIEIIIQST